MAVWEFHHKEPTYEVVMQPPLPVIEFAIGVQTSTKGWRSQLFHPRQSDRSDEHYYPPRVHVSLMPDNRVYRGLPDPCQPDPPGST